MFRFSGCIGILSTFDPSKKSPIPLDPIGLHQGRPHKKCLQVFILWMAFSWVFFMHIYVCMCVKNGILTKLSLWSAYCASYRSTVVWFSASFLDF